MLVLSKIDMTLPSTMLSLLSPVAALMAMMRTAALPGSCVTCQTVSLEDCMWDLHLDIKMVSRDAEQPALACTSMSGCECCKSYARNEAAPACTTGMSM